VHEIEWSWCSRWLLTALVCWMFLGSLSSTLNVVLAIPMSLLGTVAVIYFLGFTLNTFTLLALSLAVGIVVDDAIMVLENIFRHAEDGKDRVTAARRGHQGDHLRRARRDAGGVRDLPAGGLHEGGHRQVLLAVRRRRCRVAVLLSYLEAITLAPARCAQLLDEGEARAATGPGKLIDARFRGPAPRLYELGAAPARCGFPVLMVIASAGLLLFGLAVGHHDAGAEAEFVPSQDQSRRDDPHPARRSAADLDETDRIFRPIEEFCSPGRRCSAYFAIVGGFGGGGVNTASVSSTLKPPTERKLSQAEFCRAGAQGAQLVSRACAPWCRTCRSRASRRSAASRSSSRCAARTGTQLVAASRT
jgi:multidrug efflux pump subunit AcrB